MTPLSPILIIGGPTASGKSALALALAREFAGTIINADSMQVYADLRILTNRPDAAEEALAPHRLFGCLDAGFVCSAAHWLELAEAEIAAARAAGRLPILVGGTGLYFRALLQGLALIPPIPPEIRAEARELRERLGAEAFHARLAACDAEAAARLPPGDTQRLIRAYEVVAATGRTLGAWHRDAGQALPPRRVASLVLLPPRAELYAVCDARTARMAAAGVLEEVRALIGRNLDPALPAMKAVGLPAFSRHLAGELSLDQALGLCAQATRNYAKRQYTWFRHQMPDAHPLQGQYSESFLPEIFSFIRQFLLTTTF